tara:strand:- start:20 stop:286 length:267 start_codon:yes stop_codon:yes gene_type:complete
MYLSETEEWFAIFICFLIVIGFIASTIQNIRETVSEEKLKYKQKKKEEEKVKNLIKYLDTKSELINSVLDAQKKLDDQKKSITKNKSK